MRLNKAACDLHQNRQNMRIEFLTSLQGKYGT